MTARCAPSELVLDAGPVRGGFSLLELIIVMAIIAIVAAIAAPRYGEALARYRADSAARRVAADLDRARATARAASADVTVIFNVAGDDYTMTGVPALNNPAVDASLDLAGPPYHTRLDSAVLGGDAIVIFDGFGMPDSGGAIKVSCGSNTRIVNLNAATGVVAVAVAP
ncbi:MAG: prepilin-type N-terminal cleavage/methylation domain-containing protein [Planctomycetota bacterium]|jgi:prepilin-type N-terminal cleavage/methylation domain-containing protein